MTHVCTKDSRWKAICLAVVVDLDIKQVSYEVREQFHGRYRRTVFKSLSGSSGEKKNANGQLIYKSPSFLIQRNQMSF